MDDYPSGNVTPSSLHEGVYTKVTKKDGTFSVINPSPNWAPRSTATLVHSFLKGRSKSFHWTGESDVTQLVVLLLTEILNDLEMDHLDIFTQFSIFQFRPDAAIVTSVGGVPFCVIEVKRPDLPNVDITNQSAVHGQIYDYMKTVKEGYGVEDIFGIITDFKHWRICWLEDNQLAAATTIESNWRLNTKTDIEEINDQDAYKSRAISRATSKGIQNHTILVTPCYDYQDHPTLYIALASLLMKLGYSRIKPVKLIDSKRVYNSISSKGYEWRIWNFGEEFELNYNQTPIVQKDTELILLRSLGSGRDGHAWLACDPEGNVCCLKFFHQTLKGEEKNMETTAWEVQTKHNVPSAIFIKIPQHVLPGNLPNGVVYRDVLVMPYLQNLSVCLKNVGIQKTNQLMIQAGENLAKKGLLHPDIKPNHFGFHSPSKSLVLIDLFGITKVDAKDAKRINLEKITQLLFSEEESEGEQSDEGDAMSASFSILNK
eukprot:TRINITY_DN9060_c0_g1_i1.p1 TRINITY_DN9060_c0_g1~~TRINITY_DN9060_c0_g1_i1.p1  ORF type:complete len:486 (+),score=66.85 TRINITY_DN9060_c0_g1_i1:186-1643(+)